MNLLLDTQVLIWLSGEFRPSQPPPISPETLRLLEDPDNTLHFSSVAVWEVAIKTRLGRASFQIHPGVFRRALLDNGYLELPITSEHGAAVARLPPIHRDPFDRILVAQAMIEGFFLLTADELLTRYPGSVRRV